MPVKAYNSIILDFSPIATFFFFGCIRSSLCHVESFIVVHRFSSCGVWVQELLHTGLVAPRHVES